jgi:hypothetical protein
MGTGDDLPQGKSGREADNSPPSSAEVKNDEAISQLPHIFMA